MKTKSVSLEEFDRFMKTYQRPVVYDVARMYEPPLHTWNDPTLGDWPESVVASFVGYNPDDEDAIFSIREQDQPQQPHTPAPPALE